MEENKFKYQFGLFIILSHILIILSLILLRIIGGFDQEEFSTLLGIIMPMFSGYSTSILLFIISDRHNVKLKQGRQLTFSYRLLAFTFTSLFLLIIGICIWLQGYNLAFEDFENFKAFVLSIESIFAIYCGYLVHSVFKKIEEKKPE